MLRLTVLVIPVLFFLVSNTTAATITSNNVTGNWNAGATWVGGVPPGPGDDVIINTSATITVTASTSCASISWTGNPTASRTLTVNAGVTLSVSGTITLGSATTNGRNRVINVLGTLNCGDDFTMQTSGNDARDVILSIGTNGIVTVTGNLVMASSFNRHHVDMTGNAQINIGGNIAANAAGSATGGGFTNPPAGSIINLNGSLPQNYWPQNVPTHSGTLKINNPAGVTFRKAINLNASTLTIGDIVSNSLLKDSGFAISCTGTLNLQNASTYQLGRVGGTGGTSTQFPSFGTQNIESGTTIHYAHANTAQTVSTIPSYANLLLSTTGSFNKTIAAGTLTVRGNLTIQANTTYNGANDPVVNIGGDFTNNGTFTSGDGLYTMNGAADQGIIGSSSPTFTGGLVVANTGAPGNNTVTLSTNISVNNVLTVESGVFDLGIYTANRAVAGGTLIIANDSRLVIGGPNTLPANYSTHVIGGNSFVEYKGNNSVVAALNSAQSYGNLIISGTGVTSVNSFSVSRNLSVTGSFTASAGTVTMNSSSSSIINNGNLIFNNLFINATPLDQNQYNTSYDVNGLFEVGAGITFTPTGGTVTMTGTSGQINNSGGTLTFSGLTIEGTIAASGNMGANGTMFVTGSFNPNAATIIGGAGILNGTGSIYVTRITTVAGFAGQFTINSDLLGLTTIYNGADNQIITAENYGTLVVADNGARTVTLVANETIAVAGEFIPDQDNTAYVVTNNTFNYNGNQNQTIAGFTYHNLMVSGTGDKTIPTGVTVNCSGLDIVTDVQLNIQGTAALNFL